MREMKDFDVLILPGWQNSGPDHWHTHWQAAFPRMRRVEQSDWESPVYSDWSRALTGAVNACERPALLVTHSLSNALVARWSHEAGTKAVAGAFLVAPTDLDRFAGTHEAHSRGFDPLVMKRLPFPSFLLSSRDDPRVGFERAQIFAAAWGSRFVDVGPLGHIGSTAKLGLWPQGLVLFGQFIASLG
jgi:serine hydrolase